MIKREKKPKDADGCPTLNYCMASRKLIITQETVDCKTKDQSSEPKIQCYLSVCSWSMPIGR